MWKVFSKTAVPQWVHRVAANLAKEKITNDAWIFSQKNASKTARVAPRSPCRVVWICRWWGFGQEIWGKTTVELMSACFRSRKRAEFVLAGMSWILSFFLTSFVAFLIILTVYGHCVIENDIMCVLKWQNIICLHPHRVATLYFEIFCWRRR